MNHSHRTITLGFIVLLLCFFLTARNAFAYIDPGTGSYLFQLMVAGFLGLLFTVRGYAAKIKDFLRKILSRKRH